MLGIDAELVVDAGAYALWPKGPSWKRHGRAQPARPVHITSWRVKTFTVATNKSPIGPYRGVGRPGACFAIERTIDEVARAAGRDPLEVRIENMVRPEQMPFTTVAGMVFDNGDYAQSARVCADLIDIAAIRARQRAGEPDGRLVGIGFAVFAEQTGHGCGEWVLARQPVHSGLRELHRAYDERRHGGADGGHPVAWPRAGDHA